MKKTVLLLGSALLFGSLSAYAQQVKLTNNTADKKVEVSVDGKPFTAYIYPGPDQLKKASLYPVRTAARYHHHPGMAHGSPAG